MVQTDTHVSIVKGLEFASSFIPDFTDSILHTQETRTLEEMSMQLHRRMRRTLPVPTIYTSLMILARLAEFARMQQDALENEELVALPKTKNNVDFTVKKIFKAWNKQVSKFTSSNSDFKENGWNAWGEVTLAIEAVVKTNLSMFFGIEK